MSATRDLGGRLLLFVVPIILVVVETWFLLVPAEAHGFPAGIPVTCGGPYRLLTGDWLQTAPENGAAFPDELRWQWESECREQAARQAGIGVTLLLAGAFTVSWRRRRRHGRSAVSRPENHGRI